VWHLIYAREITNELEKARFVVCRHFIVMVLLIDIGILYGLAIDRMNCNHFTKYVVETNGH